jgi:hypothetical protein
VKGHVTPRPLFTSGNTRYPLYRRLGGLQGRSGQVRKISPSTGIRSPDRPARSQSLYRLRYPAHNIAPRSQKSVLLSSVLHVSEVTFVTNLSSTSVIGQAMKGVLSPLGQTGHSYKTLHYSYEFKFQGAKHFWLKSYYAKLFLM